LRDDHFGGHPVARRDGFGQLGRQQVAGVDQPLAFKFPILGPVRARVGV
jgi:hypothetical protein